MTKYRFSVASLLVLLSLLVGCGGHTATTTSTTATTPIQGAVPYPDPEPRQISLGQLPGTHGNNGDLTVSSLAPIYQGRLARQAAAAWNTQNLEARARFHHTLTPNGSDSSYRPYSRQVYYRNFWCGQGRCQNAAFPGTSNHGWGRAVDTGCGLSRHVVDSIGSHYGWHWGEVSYECWHVTYYGGFKRPDPGSNYVFPTLRVGSGGYGQASWVRAVQYKLRYLGFHVAPSGYYGPATRTDIAIFQRHVHWRHPNGIVSRAVWISLNRSVYLKRHHRRPW